MKITQKKTKIDWAYFLAEIAEYYSDAEKITLVMDNLNTHTPGSLYEAFQPAKAKQLWDRYDFVFTPKHDSWLNMAEMELNAQLIDYFYLNFNPSKWKGFTLLAIDGTTVQLPRIESIVKHFGAWNPRQGDACPMARVSQLFDPLNSVTVDARIDPNPDFS